MKRKMAKNSRSQQRIFLSLRWYILFISADNVSQISSITISFIINKIGRNLEDGRFTSIKAGNGLDIPVVGLLIAPFEIHGHRV